MSQGRLAGHDCDSGKEDQSQIVRKAAAIDVQQGETAFPWPNDLVVQQVRVRTAAQDITFVGKHDGGWVGDSGPDGQHPPFFQGVEASIRQRLRPGADKAHVADQDVP